MQMILSEDYGLSINRFKKKKNIDLGITEWQLKFSVRMEGYRNAFDINQLDFLQKLLTD